MSVIAKLKENQANGIKDKICLSCKNVELLETALVCLNHDKLIMPIFIPNKCKDFEQYYEGDKPSKKIVKTWVEKGE